MKVLKHLSLLGLKAEDKVTGFKGIIASVSFDLYGCVQAIVNPGMDSSGKLGEPYWFDVNRLKILDETPVMDLPNFEEGPQADGKQGAAEKPRSNKC